MLRFALRRFRDGFVLLLLIVVVVFILGYVVGNPASALLPQDATPEELARVSAQLGTDRPLHVQFADYFAGVFQGDFGESYFQGRPAMDVVLDGLGATMLLALVAIAIGGVIGCGAGVIAGARPNSIFDRATNFLGIVAISIPNFWLGLILITVFAVNLGMVPTSGFFDWKAIILPAMTLGIVRAGRIYNVVRSATFDEMTKPYVTVFQSKGLPHRVLVYKHVMRNVGVAMSTATGWELVRMIGGGLSTVEIVFAWPGIGLTLITAARVQDFPVVIAATVVMGSLVVLSNALVDVLYRIVDPRVETTA